MATLGIPLSLNKTNVPETIQDVNVFIDGVGHLGVCKNFKLPVIEQEAVEVKGALSASYGNGSLKALTSSFKIAKVDSNSISALGLNMWQNRLPFILKASLYADGKSKGVLIALTGDILKYEIGDMEAGKEVEVSIELAVHLYTLALGGIPQILVDTKNMICQFGAVDYLSDVRKNLL